MERAGRLIAKWKKSGDCVSREDLARAAWQVAVGKKIADHVRFWICTNRMTRMQAEYSGYVDTIDEKAST